MPTLWNLWNRCSLVLAAALLVGSVAAPSTSVASEVGQIKVGALTANTSTGTANTFYPATLTSTREIWGPDPAANRPAELKELARALRYNVDLIYEYVHDNIRTVFIYGVQKGALGVMIDQSGTPFDQAQLMVELLRESGYTARYKAGTLRLTSAQANDWVGTSNATALQQIFRDGGIPLDYNSTGPTYTIGHVWVEVVIPGLPASCGSPSRCWFNPSYKQHTVKPQLNLESLMGWTATEFSTTDPSGFLGQAWAGMTQQGTPADPVWVSNVNDANVQAKLTTYATTLLTALKSTAHKDKEIEDVIGGQEIVKTGATPVRNNNSLPGFTTAVQRTWDCTGNTTCGIPDPYRTKLTIGMYDFAPVVTLLITKVLFADEIYGRRVLFDTPLNLSLPGQNPLLSLEPWCVKLTVDGQPIAGAQTGCIGQSTGLLRNYIVRLEADHPYAGGLPAGSYMDLSAAAGNEAEYLADFALPVQIVHGLGDVSPALVSKLASEQVADRMIPLHAPPPPGEVGDVRGDSAMDHTSVKLAASYLAQYSRMAELEKRIGNSEHVMHHMLGVVYAEASEEKDVIPEPSAFDKEWWFRDRAIRITVDGAISVNSKSAVASERQAVIHATLAAAAALEGSIFEQELDTVGTGSTATRFQWGNANLGTNLKFYLYTPATPAAQIGTGFTELGCAGLHPVGAPPNVLPTYVNATTGFWAIAASELCLGPGNKHAPMYPFGGQYPNSLVRGGAFVAFRPDNTSVAHALTYTAPSSGSSKVFKGGGAGVPAEYAREFDATGAASLLKDQFEDRSRLHGIDLQSGELSYSAPADIRIGEGGFPYELSLSRTFKSGASKSPGLTDGWAHSLDIRASATGDGLAKMGRESAWAAAETIAAIYTAQKIYSLSPAPPPPASPTATQLRDHLKRWVLAPFVMSWWSSKLSNNSSRSTRVTTRVSSRASRTAPSTQLATASGRWFRTAREPSSRIHTFLPGRATTSAGPIAPCRSPTRRPRRTSRHSATTSTTTATSRPSSSRRPRSGAGTAGSWRLGRSPSV